MNLVVLVVLLYILLFGVVIYLSILFANFLKVGRKAFEVYIENNERQ